MKKFELVSLSMFSLDGGNKALDIEDIAIMCEEIAPGTFAWRKYKDQINLELVGFAVRDAKKAQYGRLVSGSHAKGWRLTSAGVKLAKKLIEEFSDQEIVVKPTKHRNLELNRQNKEAKRVVESEAFSEWGKDGKVSKDNLSHLLRINAYASNESIQIKVARLSKLIGLDDELDNFINYVIDASGELI